MIVRSSSRRAFLGGAGAAAIVLSCGRSESLAQSHPDQLKLLCGFPAGSVPDTVARQIANNLATSYERGCIVENRPGAAGQIAIAGLKTGPTDGSALLLAPGAIATIYPSIYSKLTYDPMADLTPVWAGVEAVLAMAVGPAVPAQVGNVAALMEWMKANPQLANVGSPGLGTPPHLVEAMLFHQAGVNWTHVPYAGGPPAINDLLGGRIAAVVLPEGVLRPHHDGGKVRIISNSGAKRSAFLPGVPTFAEQGFDKVVMTDWFGVFAPGAATPDVVNAASLKLRKALAKKEFLDALGAVGMTVTSLTPGDVKARIATERPRWEMAVKENGIRAD
jgi:tripartite-type tricarboxylate transporter receptor subunit TctC